MNGMRALIIGALASLLFAPQASAADGTYVVSACVAGGVPAPADSWEPSFTGYAEHASIPKPAATPLMDSCDAGGTFGITFPAEIAPGPYSASWTFVAPFATIVSSFRLWRRVGLQDSPGTSHLDYELRADSRVLEVDLRAPPWMLGAPGLGDDALFAVDGLAAATVSIAVRCGGSVNPFCSEPLPQSVEVARAEVTLRDGAAPTAPDAPSVEVGGLSVPFEDRGGGVRSATLLIDGVRAAETVLCREPFVARVPCPTAGRATLNLDSVPSGVHRAEVELVDAGGNRQVVAWLPVGPAAVVHAAPVVVPAAEPGRLALTGRRTLRTRYSAPPTVRGTLRDLSGAPIRRGRIAVTSRPLVGGSWSAPVWAVSDGRGKFSVRLPRGVSREVRFAYGDSVQTVTVVVAAPVRLRTDRKVTRNGRSVTFRGSVPGAGSARTRVELQAWAGSWVPFRTVALRNGRFSATYRFTRTFSATRYRFRAVVHDDRAFPYAPGTSRTVKVLVRP
jgi:hypothetical protein